MRFFDFAKQRRLYYLTVQLEDERAKLLQKNLVPHHTKGFLMGEQNLKGAVQETEKDSIKELVCPVCGIRLHNRMFMRQHIKYHTEQERYKEKVKDSEHHKVNSTVYLEGQ